jgi:DNA-binding NtrC family response regulator
MLTLLIVEDIPRLAKRVTRLFSDDLSGYRVLVASDRDFALSIAVAETPNLIVLDLAIPGSGPEDSPLPEHGEMVFDRVRELLPSTRIIILSDADHLTRDYLRVKGADDFFGKQLPAAWEREELPCQVQRMIGHVACRSGAMADLRGRLDSLGPTDRVIGITGPPGSGRRHLAEVIHLNLAGRDAKLVEEPVTSLLAGDGPVDGTGVALTGLGGLRHLSAHDQNRLAAVLTNARQGRRGPTVFLVAAGRDECLDPELAPELQRELKAATWLAMPPLEDRAEDVMELAEVFRREASLRLRKSVRTLGAGVPEALWRWISEDPHRQAADLRDLIEGAVERTEGGELTVDDLGLRLPADYVALECLDGSLRRRPLLESQLGSYLDECAASLVVYCDDPDEPTRATRLQLKGRERAIEDHRIGRLLYMLATQPGEPVELARRKRDLGLLAHQETRRYVHSLRRLLDDSEVTDRRSRFIESHYGGTYSFLTTETYVLIVRQVG